MQTLDVGEVATIRTTWYDGTGAAAEPSAITLTIHPPSAPDIVVTKAMMTGSVSGAAAGTQDVWSYGQTVDTEGLWRYDVAGVVAGDNVALPSGAFLVGVGMRENTGPCEPWTTWGEIEACSGPMTGVSAAQREMVIDEASEILFNLTDRVYSGICETTRSLCYSCRTCWPTLCSCVPWNGVDLGVAFPVWGAWDVTVDGVVLPASATKVVDRRWLVRLDGGVWPSGWDVTDADAFRASWAYGRRIPTGGRTAARRFATEIAKLCAGDKSCILPQRVTSITREGVSYTILDSLKMIDDGKTGIPLVDQWIVADRKGRKARPGVFAPGMRSRPERIA